MIGIIEKLNSIFCEAFDKAGYAIETNSFVQSCNMPQMGDFQCNLALSLAKIYKTSPMQIANNIVSKINDSCIKSVSVANPGYINIFVSDELLNDYLNNSYNNLDKDINFDNRKIVVDYGGANVAKPLHVGHLRPATIGESVKRICKYVGNQTVGDVHLGDWGLQMGMIIYELKNRHPEWVYFDDNFDGVYPQQSPITIKDLEILYPQANAKAKSDEVYMEYARQTTFELQNGKRGYVELWKKILEVSKADLKKNYDCLDVNFELWLGESDTQRYCNQVIDEIVDKGLAKQSMGALVVDVTEPDDKNEIPPFILKKSDGAVLYSTTDLATIVQRDKELNADKIIYVVDNRQDMHFTQLFRCAKKTGILSKDIEFEFIGFGTMNGKDGKPYKTRDGGVMQLNQLISEVKSKAYEKVSIAKNQSDEMSEEEMLDISNKVAIAALKFADLSIYRSKDYVFDIDKFCSFDGKTGPYLLYTITRAKSILRKANFDTNKVSFDSQYFDRQFLFALTSYNEEIVKAYKELAPNIICDYVYKVANLFNAFYNSCNIINETNELKKNAMLSITDFTLKVLEKIMYLLGIQTLDRM